MNDHTFERTIQITKIVLLTALLVLGAVWYLNGTHTALAQAAAGYKFVHIASATNTQVQATSVGTLHTITVNGGTAGAVTIVDTTAANCTGGSTIGIIGTSTVFPSTATYDLQTTNGLCISTAAATDVTVAYK